MKMINQTMTLFDSGKTSRSLRFNIRFVTIAAWAKIPFNLIYRQQNWFPECLFKRTSFPGCRVAASTAFAVLFSTQVLADCVSETQPDERSKRFIVQKVGTILMKNEVLDQKTGLIWKICSTGFSIWMDECKKNFQGDANYSYLLTWREANQAAHAAGPGWRLPTKAELESLVVKGCVNPAIDKTVFPLTLSEWYWTSSDSDDRGVWQVFFGDGHSALFNRDASPSALRLVKSAK
jgi:hypothetical protein